jgi:archaellum component FlaF (FlaF/FlaG flagellin family)
MIMVSAALVVIGLLYLSIGSDVLYSDHIAKEKQLEYKQMLAEKEKQQQSAVQSPGKDLSVNLNEDVKMQGNP